MTQDQGGGAGKPLQGAGTAATENPGGGEPGKRVEVGDAATSQRHQPHVTANEQGAPVQAEQTGADVPVVPANASGTDKVSADRLPRQTDAESAYDKRPSEDKNAPPGR